MDIVVRAAAVWLVLLVVTRVMGRREMAEMEPFDVILLVVVGDLVQQGVTQSDYSVTGAVLAVLTIVLLTVATSYLSFRLPRLRPALEGHPVVLIADGRLVEENLRRERITVEELQAQARLQQIARLGDVRWAVLERGGQISFLG